MSKHQSLDISPVPENVLFINETNIADASIYDMLKDRTDQMEDDNVRICIPLTVNVKP